MAEIRTGVGGGGSPTRILLAGAADVPTLVQPLFEEYGEWVAGRLAQELGITFTAEDLARHHDAFRRELPFLLGPRGRLLVAYLQGSPVGVGALKPVDDSTAEIKRMFVRPAAQGTGIGRTLLEALLEGARRERYTNVRLETLRFMTRARALYRALCFVETPKFEGAESTNTVLDAITLFMKLDLEPRASEDD